MRKAAVAVLLLFLMACVPSLDSGGDLLLMSRDGEHVDLTYISTSGFSPGVIVDVQGIDLAEWPDYCVLQTGMEPGFSTHIQCSLGDVVESTTFRVRGREVSAIADWRCGPFTTCQVIGRLR